MAVRTRSLEDTPTWALATVCLAFFTVSILIEKMIHLLSEWLKRHRKKSLFEGVLKLKSVLMLLGLMSLILAATQKPVSKICIPVKFANKMLPCGNQAHTKSKEGDFPGRKLDEVTTTSEAYDHCQSKGMVSLISEEGMNQLNMFIFVLAVIQIVYSFLTMALGRAKMKRWKAWEEETQTIEYQAANDSKRFRYTRETTFARRHANSCIKTSIQLWIVCFFRQFFNSVAKVDYLTLRHGFVMAHLSGNNSFNFQTYIQRSLDDDFKAVVGINPVMWLLAVIFILADVHGWHVYLWVSFVPLMIVLVLGTKLQLIVAEMALQLKDKDVTIGALLVQPDDSHFWFRNPNLILTLIHFSLFMNAFELAFFVWVTLEFGIKSCYHESIEITIIRVSLAVAVQVICSYITLPLYALVIQMGSQFKSPVLDNNTANILKRWHAEVREKIKKHKHSFVPLQDYYSSIYASNRAGSPNNSPRHQRPQVNENVITTRSSIVPEIEIVEYQERNVVGDLSSRA